MSERMNKERAKEEIIATRKTFADKKQKLEEKNEFEKSELLRRENKSFIHLYDKKIQALDIAIESLQDEDLDISMDWLDEFVDWAKHRVKYTHEHYSDIIDIRMTDSELIRIIKILENYKAKVEPYERKE